MNHNKSISDNISILYFILHLFRLEHFWLSTNIKHRKAAQDAKRSKAWTRIIKELTIAARDGGPDPDTSPSLRLAIQNAKGSNMPKDTIERAILRGAGGLEGAELYSARQ